MNSGWPAVMVRWMDERASLNRTRRLAHAIGRKVAFGTDCICIAACVIALLTFSLAGFNLVTAARLWGGFWTHFAAATPEARLPVTLVMLGALALTSTLVAFCRAPGQFPKRTPNV